jgi:glycosyltransferase involved in cell wall biosynthesis
MLRPEISVVIPARNERSRLAPTIQAIARARSAETRVEFVIVDDASTDGCIANLVSAVPRLLQERSIDVRVYSLEEHSGIYRARNHAAELANGEILFITDAHVQFSQGWDEQVLRHIRPGRIIAGTTSQPSTGFRGYGCKLLIPFMGTTWNQERRDGLSPVPLAACSATVIPRDLFFELGGYDPDMLVYGAGEPEFSVRAWLHGAEIFSLPDLEVQHEFKARDELWKYLHSIRPFWVHNCLRFGLLYLSEMGCMQLLRFYARAFPAVFQKALLMLDESNVWQRREQLEHYRERSFDWYVGYFGMKNQIGGEII